MHNQANGQSDRGVIVQNWFRIHTVHNGVTDSCGSDREREREKEKERDRERERKKEIDREKEREREREKDLLEI